MKKMAAKEADFENSDSLNDSFVDEPSDEEEPDVSDEEPEPEPPKPVKPPQLSVAQLLAQLKSSGAAVVKKPVPVERFQCFTCDEEYPDRDELLTHLREHVSLPSVVVQKLLSDDEVSNFDDNEDEWSEEDPEEDIKVPISHPNILKLLPSGSGISIKKANDKILSNIDLKNLCVKKVLAEDKKESTDSKAEISGDAARAPPIRMTIKHTEGKDHFQVVNGDEKLSEATKKISMQQVQSQIMKSYAESEVVDSKEGILESVTKIKTEPVNPVEYQSSAPAAAPVSRPAPLPPAKIKNEPGIENNIQPVAVQPGIPMPMVIPKKEPEPACITIEINGDDDDDDDCMFVQTMPGEDKKPDVGLMPPLPKATITEITSPPPNPGMTASQNVRVIPSPQYSVPTSRMGPMPSMGTSSSTPSQMSTEKQHNFNWNAPSKDNYSSFENMTLDKNSDDIFERLLAGSGHKKDSLDLGASEYISLDRLGPQHSCEQCNTRFTDLILLENHRRLTGHSSAGQLVPLANSSNKAILPVYSSSGNIVMGNMQFPMKQLVETVGKLTTANSQPYTHQQNIMVNIQSFPGSMAAPPPQQAQNPYAYQGTPGIYPDQQYKMPPQPGAAYQQYPSAYPTNNYQQYPNQMQPPAYQQQPTAFPQQQQQQHPGVYPNTQQPLYNSPYPPTTQVNPMAMYPQNNSNPMMPPNSSPSINTSSPMISGQDMSGQPQSPNSANKGIRILGPQPGQKLMQNLAPRNPGAIQTRGMRPGMRGASRGRGAGRGVLRGAPGARPMIRTPVKRPGGPNGSVNASPSKKRLDMLLPDRHDNEDCHVISMQQRDGPQISNVHGSKADVGVNLSSQITVTKTKVRPPSPPPPPSDGRAVASMLAQRGIKITQKVRSPSPPRISIPNLGSAISITSSRASASALLDEAADYACPLCPKAFHNAAALGVHTTQMHAPQKIKCDSCPVSYPTVSQLAEHKRSFHNAGLNSEMGLPVVDLTQQANLRKLNSLGIVNFIPLANHEQAGGCFGIPIVSVQNSMNGSMINSLQALGANGILSLGPVKTLPKC